jgi:hypothetical protein
MGQTFGKISRARSGGWPKSRQVIEGTAHAVGWTLASQALYPPSGDRIGNTDECQKEE